MAKAQQKPKSDPAQTWAPCDEEKLQELQKLLQATERSVKFLAAAKRRKVGPNHLSVLIMQHDKKRDQLIAKLDARVKELGGHRQNIHQPLKPENGMVTDWKYFIPVSEHFGLVYEMNRLDEPEEFDAPVAFIPHVVRAVKGKFPLSKRCGVQNRLDEDDLPHWDDWNPCTTLSDFSRSVASLTKYATKQTEMKNYALATAPKNKVAPRR